MKSTLALLAALILGACSTTQEIILAKSAPTRTIVAVAQVPEEGNSPEMNANLSTALVANGLTIRAAVQQGTRKAPELDAIIGYIDVWRWDLAMYMKDLTVNVYDAQTGDLLVIGRWADSALHGFRDAKQIMQTLVTDMLAKLRAATKAEPPR